jgi:hypothetical protein
MALRVNSVWGAETESVRNIGQSVIPCFGAHPLPDREDAGWHSLGDVTDGITKKEYGSSWIFEQRLTWVNALRRVQSPGFSLVTSWAWELLGARRLRRRHSGRQGDRAARRGTGCLGPKLGADPDVHDPGDVFRLYATKRSERPRSPAVR